jgi:hypothetical protein
VGVCVGRGGIELGGVKQVLFCNFLVGSLLPHHTCYKAVAITKKHCKRAQVDETEMGNEKQEVGVFIAVRTKQGI